MSLCQVSGMGGDLVRNDTSLHIFSVWQAEVFLRRHITQHRTTEPADHGCSDSRGNVIVPWRDVSRQRTKGIKWSFVAFLELFFHIHLDQMHRHMTWAFNHGLDIVFPSDPG